MGGQVVDSPDIEPEKTGARRGPGRPKGSPNKTTAAVRLVIQEFIEDNAKRVDELFARVAEDNPAKALEIYARLAEFVLPKQQRTEIYGDIGLRGQLNIHG